LTHFEDKFCITVLPYWQCRRIYLIKFREGVQRLFVLILNFEFWVLTGWRHSHTRFSRRRLKVCICSTLAWRQYLLGLFSTSRKNNFIRYFILRLSLTAHFLKSLLN
jgi:hypothetical protein